MPSPETLPEIVPGLSEPQLVGRSEQLLALDGVVDNVVSGSFQVALIEGAAGIGKTRLVAEVSARHADHATILSARSYRWGGTTSFGLWVEALDRHLRDRSEAELRRLSGASLGDLAHLLKAFETVAAVSGSQPQRGRLLEALVDLFDHLSAEQPVLVALDDIHLADTSSWEALRYLGRRLSGSPIGILATARPADLRQHPIATEVLLGLSEDGLLDRVSLEPLTHDDVAQLAHDIVGSEEPAPSFVPEALVTWLRERSLGHPLFVVSLLRALIEEQADLANPRLEKIPETLRERVELELEALAADDRKILETLAVVDRRVSVGDLVGITGRSLDELGKALENLSRSQLVAEHEAGADLRYEVVHPIIQDTIYAGIGGARRRSLHRSVARVFLDSGHLGAAAAHFARSAERGDDEVVDALCLAIGQAEERGLYQEALATLAALLDVLPAGDERWLRVLEAMNWQAEWVIGHLAEGEVDIAIGAMERIKPLVEASGQLYVQGTVNLYLATCLSIGAGRLEESERACLAAIEQFEAAGDREPALLARNELAWIHSCAGDLERAAATAHEVVEEAEASGEQRAVVQARGSEGYALARMGRFDAGEDTLRGSIRLARSIGDTYRVAWGRNQLGVLLALSGRLEEGVRWIEGALDEANVPDSGTVEYLAHTDWLRGRLASSVARIQQSEVRRAMLGSRRRAWTLALAARAYAEMGQEGWARRRVDRARATYQGRQIMDWAYWCDWADGILAWHNGEHSRALGALDDAAGWLAGMGALAYEALPLVDIAEVAAEAGDASRAATAADRLASIAAEVDGDIHLSLAALGAAWSHLAKGRAEEAAAAGHDATQQFAAAGYELYRGSALEVKGRALETSDRGRAIEALREASEVFAACGAVWRRDRTLSRLGGLGSRGRRAASGVLGLEALTQREREIAVLAVRGQTAQETAEQLFISRRTVESHLANIYAKLGVASKRELMRRAEELGL